MNPLHLKILGAVLAMLMIANFILYFLSKISSLQFWITIALFAIVAWGIIPRLKKA